MSEESNFDFEGLLDTNMDDIKEPLPLPAGLYDWTVSSEIEYGESSKKGTPYIRLYFTDPVPVSEVDEDEFAACMESRPNGVKLKNDFYMSEAAQFMFKGFMKAVGIDTTNRKVKACLEEAKGEQVGGIVEVGLSDKGRPFSQISEFCVPS